MVVLLAGALRADSLDAILQRMDDGAKKFKAVTANFKQVTYTAVLQESSTQAGDLRLLRRGKGGVIGVMHFNPPEESIVGFSGKIVEKYYPKANQVERFDVGKNAAQIDQFILLTFGAAGSDLTQTYEVKIGGAETIASTPCSRLELVPKSPDARKIATRITLWIPEGKSYAIQEKVDQPSGNYDLNSYSDVNLHPQMPDSAFELKVPPNAKVVNLK
jgi:outer membrane lipoprotein-sorting protein